MLVILPLEVYESFEKVLGHDDAKGIVKALEATISDLTEYKWKTSEEELLSEMEKKFATKADLALLESKLHGEFKRIDGEFKALRLEIKLLFLIIITPLIMYSERAIIKVCAVGFRPIVLTALAVLAGSLVMLFDPNLPGTDISRWNRFVAATDR
ncbi:membrane protein [Candidatus Magnetobacterium bavaricum]|uniref:Membrane protein n=1 Tax=Candidatus Magnetobacterium bavaricum TaxID=29290 RepID=A0A0F3GUG7_9BACT|nr:membrane protein [Candidatus Magnetobacterium bavaricum]